MKLIYEASCKRLDPGRSHTGLRKVHKEFTDIDELNAWLKVARQDAHKDGSVSDIEWHIKLA
jgi:hypothetical protein